jgi:hypothetical protein
MKTVYYIKDTFLNKTFRVTYFQKNAIKNNINFQYNEETGENIQVIEESYYDKLLFCQRLEWETNEVELDTYIEEVRQYWENRINT